MSKLCQHGRRKRRILSCDGGNLSVKLDSRTGLVIRNWQHRQRELSAACSRRSSWEQLRMSAPGVITLSASAHLRFIRRSTMQRKKRSDYSAVGCHCPSGAIASDRNDRSCDPQRSSFFCIQSRGIVLTAAANQVKIRSLSVDSNRRIKRMDEIPCLKTFGRRTSGCD